MSISRVSVSVSSGGSLLVSSKCSTSNNHEWNVKDLHSLCLDLLGTLSQEPESHRQAEVSLSEASQYPNYNLPILSIVAQLVYDEKIRQRASFNFINQRKGWQKSPRGRVPIGSPTLMGGDFEAKRVSGTGIPELEKFPTGMGRGWYWCTHPRTRPDNIYVYI
ncbi:hypothetical protein CerSpe_084600 [Prunus speciosa]